MLKDISAQSGPELSNFNWEDPQSDMSSRLLDITATRFPRYHTCL